MSEETASFGWVAAKSRLGQAIVGILLAAVVTPMLVVSMSRVAGPWAGLAVAVAILSIVVGAILRAASAVTHLPIRWVAALGLPVLIFLAVHPPSSTPVAAVAAQVPAVAGTTPTLASQDWNGWAGCVLAGIGAPVTVTDLASLSGWTRAEKPAGQPVQWNNPLNTTQPEPEASNMNSVGVKAYADLGVGCQATVATLLNGRYPDIVAALRNSQPASQWNGTCRYELGVWGTGSGWLG